MTFIKYLQWIISAALAFALVALIDVPFSRIRNKIIKAVIFLVKAAFVITLAYFLIAAASPFLWKYNYPLSGLYIALLSDCFCDLFMLATFFIREKPRFFRTVALAVITLIVFVYGTVNMQIIRADPLTYRSGKLKEEHTFVFLSDLHYGSSQSKKTVEKAFAEIGELHPDFILLGGDITDEHTEKEEMEWVYEQIGSLDVPVYYVYGNHDRQERGDYLGGEKYTDEELEDAITGNGIIILKDETVQISDDIVLLGREDPSWDDRKTVSELPERPAGTYVISIDHTPYQNQEIIDTKADLQLSGHTHAGQYFPLRYIYALIGLNVYGEYHFGDTDLFVSPGITGWYLPFRNEVHCTYEVVTLLPE